MSDVECAESSEILALSALLDIHMTMKMDTSS